MNNADQLTNGTIVEMLVSPNGMIYSSASALNLDGDIDYEVNLSHQVGEVLPNGEVFSYYEDYCHVIIVYDGDQVLQNLIDVEYMCHYIEQDAEIHVLLDMENQTDSWFGFEIRNMSRDYEYDVHGTFTEDSNEISNFSYAPIPNAGAGSTHTNWVSQFFPQPGKEYCVEAVLTEKWIHDPFAPWENSRSANYCVTFDGNQTNENNTGNQSGPSPEIFANLSLQDTVNVAGHFRFIGNYSLSNVSIGETYTRNFWLFHATDSTCSENVILGYNEYTPGFALDYIEGNLAGVGTSDDSRLGYEIVVDESMNMTESTIFDRDFYYPDQMDYSVMDSYYCLKVELISGEEIIDTDIDSVPWVSIMDEPNPELSVEFIESEIPMGEGTSIYLQRIDIDLNATWYGYNHSISLKLANEDGIIIYSYFSPNDDFYDNEGWHSIYTSKYDQLV